MRAANIPWSRNERLADLGISLADHSQCDGNVSVQKEPLARSLCLDCYRNSVARVHHDAARPMDRADRTCSGSFAFALAVHLLWPVAAPRFWARGARVVILGRYEPKGRLTPGRRLDDLTWLRVGGPADYLFQPEDIQDLAQFLAGLPPEIDVFPMGVGSNLIVRDGGIRAVVIRMGRGFNHINVENQTVTAGVAALDAHVARRAAEAGVDLTFLRTIPGAIGGAVRMNAGCYGSYVADVFTSARAITRDGKLVTLEPGDLNFRYRQTDLPQGWVIVEATFQAPTGDPAILAARMEAQIKKRDETQPTKDRTAGSTFRNPAGFSSTGHAGDSQELKAWKVIDDAGMRGATHGGAQMSPKHPNFLVNTGSATAADLEELGEEVRKKVFQNSGIKLEWEIMRVGQKTPE